jgi:hypothetical protein
MPSGEVSRRAFSRRCLCAPVKSFILYSMFGRLISLSLQSLQNLTFLVHVSFRSWQHDLSPALIGMKQTSFESA